MGKAKKEAGSKHEPFSPEKVFSTEASSNKIIPNVLNSPQKYIQGDGVLGDIGLYLGLIGSTHAAILITGGRGKKIRRDGVAKLKALRYCRNTRNIFRGMLIRGNRAHSGIAGKGETSCRFCCRYRRREVPRYGERRSRPVIRPGSHLSDDCLDGRPVRRSVGDLFP